MLEKLDELIGQNISSLLLSESIVIWIDLTDENKEKIYSILARLEQENYLAVVFVQRSADTTGYIQIAPTVRMKAIIKKANNGY